MPRLTLLLLWESECSLQQSSKSEGGSLHARVGLTPRPEQRLSGRAGARICWKREVEWAREEAELKVTQTTEEARLA